MNLRFRLGAAVAALAAYSAMICGAALPGVAAAGDPCATISTSDVSSALGAPVTTTKRRQHGTQGASCSFRTAHFSPYATITAIRFHSASEASSTFRDMIAQNAKMESQKPVPLHGIGDDAAVVSTIVYTRKGSAIYTFSIVDGARTAQSIPKSEALAKATLAHVQP